MKLELRGHAERYTVEQSLLNLFPGELPEYAPIQPVDDNWAVTELSESGGTARASAELCVGGNRGAAEREAVLPPSEYEQERVRRRLIGQCFYLAAREAAGVSPPWGMLSGVRPDKLVTRALLDGKSADEARRILTEDCFVTPRRAALALETGTAAFQAARSLGPRDTAVYVGIPFCPTHCAYCSFVSQSVEKSFSLVPPYVDALCEELTAGGELCRSLGLRVRAFYMGGGTPTTLSPEQIDRVLSAFQDSFDTSACSEYTVEAGRPDTITDEKLSVLRSHGVGRVSVNPQSMEDAVLRAIGRRHTAEDTVRAVERVRRQGFPVLNMDLIAGLPGDTPEGFARTLQRCLDFRPENLTVHTLALKKGSRILTEGLPVPPASDVEAMLDGAEPALRWAGYAPYYLYRQKYMSGSFENTGWTLPGGTCLYNIVMMSELRSVLAFGAGGTTKLIDGPRIQRLFHPKYPGDYLARREKTDREAIEAFFRDAPSSVV